MTEFETQYVYRVWYEGCSKQAFFTDKEDAKKFAASVKGVINKWSWQIKLKK